MAVPTHVRMYVDTCIYSTYTLTRMNIFWFAIDILIEISILYWKYQYARNHFLEAAGNVYWNGSTVLRSGMLQQTWMQKRLRRNCMNLNAAAVVSSRPSVKHTRKTKTSSATSWPGHNAEVLLTCTGWCQEVKVESRYMNPNQRFLPVMPQIIII